ncbi:MAG: WD40 repeat domain-containing protein [Candidatus Burarchaeum sp.]|nr:WD40 repeat domain-containing protein [Candidatus Burarchaeum sp.]MDO8339092.1 WD40 repeat domain-containing protein [Candidatus Burarchaeum sp.]
MERWKNCWRFVVVFLLFASFCIAEDKPSQQYVIPEKLVPTPDDPELIQGSVFPPYGAPCTNYTYITVYRDREGRPPAYVKLYLNNEWHDLQKLQGSDYKSGVMYGYSFVPTSLKANFYYFEASNGLGKARAAIIESPDNGPQLFSSSFENNAVYLFDFASGALKWRFQTGKEWVGHVKLSQDGSTIAVKTSNYLFLLSRDGAQFWNFTDRGGGLMMNENEPGGVAIADDGSTIAIAQGSAFYLFDADSNRPVWQKSFETNAISVDISADGKYAAVGLGTGYNSGNRVVMLDLGARRELWSYQAPAYFQSVDLTPDGQYLAAATGCPDRRAYMFARESNATLARSDGLTRDSPGKQARISDDGLHAAFSFDGEQGKPNIFYFSRSSSQPLWSYMPNGIDSRSLGMSADGGTVAAGTSASYMHVFDSTGSLLWSYNAGRRVGALDVSRDGERIAAGTTGRKILAFPRASSSPIWTYDASEWVSTIAFSGDGKLVAAGTGPVGYFFETDFAEDEARQWDCSVINNPDLEGFIAAMGGGEGEGAGNAECGNDMCEPSAGESSETCPSDCMAGGEEEGVCGDDDCSPRAGETPFSCPEDCNPAQQHQVPAQDGQPQQPSEQPQAPNQTVQPQVPPSTPQQPPAQPVPQPQPQVPAPSPGQPQDVGILGWISEFIGGILRFFGIG